MRSTAPDTNSTLPPREEGASAISIQDLVIRYPITARGWKPAPSTEKTAVAGLSLQIQPGEVFGFLGPNGAGKTSTMNALLGFVTPSSGSAFIFGVPVGNPKSRSRLGYLPELTYYYRFLSGRELLRFYARLFELPRSLRNQRIEELLRLVEMEAAADQPIRTYSKGMQQRIGLAQALINDPDILVFDEPTSGLDPLGRMKVREIIQKLKERGKTVFFSSHELGEVETVCDRVAILHRGVVREEGPVSALVAKYNCNLEQVFLRVVGGAQP